MREHEHYHLADTFSEMTWLLMEGEYQKGEVDLDSKMRRLKDLSAYSLARDITCQREGVELLALARFFGLTSESRFQRNRKRLNLLAGETIEYQDQAGNIEQEIKELAKRTPPRSALDRGLDRPKGLSNPQARQCAPAYPH
jgi:hypothetical protein